MTSLSYDIVRTPIGAGVAVVSDVGLRALSFDGAPPEHAVERLTRALACPLEPDPDAVCGVAGQLAEYFDGERTRFDIDIDWSGVVGFRLRALQAICAIPFGETAGYGEIAIAAGTPRAARAVGTACATTPISVVIPAHRVVRADGSIGEYGGRPDVKRFLLDLEAAGAPEDAAPAP